MTLNAHNSLQNQTVEPDGAKEGKNGYKEYEKQQHVNRKVRMTATDPKFLPYIILNRNMTLKYGMFH